MPAKHGQVQTQAEVWEAFQGAVPTGFLLCVCLGLGVGGGREIVKRARP